MFRSIGTGAPTLKRFLPASLVTGSVVMLGCVFTSTSAVAAGLYPQVDQATVIAVRDLLSPGFGQDPVLTYTVDGLGLSNPLTGVVVPPFQYSLVDPVAVNTVLSVPVGTFLSRSSVNTGASRYRLTAPLTFSWAGTTTTPPLWLTWKVGTIFDNLFNGATAKSVAFKLDPGSSIAPESQTQGQGTFDLALLPTDPGTGGEDGPGDGPNPGEGTSVPGPLPLAGAAIAWSCSRRLRKRLRQVR